MLSPSPNLHSYILPFDSIFIFSDFVLFCTAMSTDLRLAFWQKRKFERLAKEDRE